MLGMSNLQRKTSGKSRVERPTTELYSRWRDGADKVKVTQAGFQLVRSDSRGSQPIQTFTSARQLLIAITGHPNARNWTFDRYFRTGRHASNLTLAHNQPREAIFDLLIVDAPSGVTTLPSDFEIETSEAITVTPVGVTNFGTPDVSSFVTSVQPETLGIDLVNRSHEVAKLFYAGFGQRVYAAGYEPEDVLQEVYKGLLTRNTGTCPWDPNKSSFGHYVHMVAGCIVANYHRKMTRRRAVEQVGAPGFDHGDLTNVDVASSASLLTNPIEGSQAVQMQRLEAQDLVSFIRSDSRTQSRDGQLALRLLPYVEEGYTRQEMAGLVGVSTNLVSRALVLIKRIAHDWKTRHHQSPPPRGTGSVHT